ncbi:MAG: Ig-like domain-containing protein [Ruminococcus sp.]|nr:Ig-like domain-containing protein [Ruminococcus sp.]
MKRMRKLLIAMVLTIVIAVSLSVTSSAASSKKWTAAWGTAPTQIAVSGYDNIAAVLENVTVRTVITPTTSGSKVRLRFSNYYGTRPLKLDLVTIADAVETSIDPNDATSEIDVSTLKNVTFNNGSATVEIPAGKEIYSDAIDFKVTAMKNIAISMYAKEATEIKTMGLSGGSTFLDLGDNTASAKSVGISNKVNPFTLAILKGLANSAGNDVVKTVLNLVLNDMKLSFSIVSIVPCLASMDVWTDKDAYSIAIIGDSTITNDFPMYLAEQINNTGTKNVGVLGKGILGNRILGEGLGYVGLVFGESMIDRLERDVLSQSNIKYVIVKIGANDIMHPVCIDIQEQYPGIQQATAEEIIEGYRTVFQKCHDAGKKVIAIGITQWKGNTRNYFNTGDKYIRTEEEFKADWQIALDVNEWLRTSDEHDGYFNFNKISQSENDPDAFRPEYTVDGAHPTPLLQQVWAKNFPLKLVGVTQHVLGVKLNATTAKINVGNTKKLTATVTPSNAVNKAVTWTSSNPSVASVDSTGKVTALKNGTATITCKSVDNGCKATCKVTVIIAPTKVTLNKTSATIYTTKSLTLKSTIAPSNATNKNVKWSSSNTKVATVDSKGVVKAVAAGTATITCKAAEGSAQATCKITVRKKTNVTSVTLNATEKTVYTGKTYQLKATVNPSAATFKDVTWSSSNKAVATVDKNGKVKALKVGTATITCKSNDNTKATAKCSITVKAKVTGVTLSSKTASVFQNAKLTLKATIAPSNASNKKVTWTSSNKSIATVSSSGVVTGMKPGTATITCTTADGGFKATCKVTVKKVIKSTAVKLNKTSISLSDGTSYTLTPTFTPSNTSYKTVTWKSSNTSVAKVNASGKVTAVAPGKATITCTTKDSGKTATCVVTVKAVKATGVKLNKTTASVNEGASVTLKATLVPSNATNKNVTWKSSNTSVATVNASGKVTAKKVGTATITCTTKDGNKTAKCTVTVKPTKVTGVSLNRSTLSLDYGKTYTLTATIAPSNASNKKVTWRSSNSSVAKVDSNGKVTGVGNGKAVITCTTADGSITAQCTVTVKKTEAIAIKLNVEKLNMQVGATYKMTAQVLPENSSNKKVTWSSSDSSVAKVDSNGKVTAVGKGSCRIKAQVTNSNVVATCIVTVK